MRHPNRVGGLRKNYMVRKYPRKGNPHRKRGLAIREVGCWFCIPGNRQRFLQKLELET